MGAKGKGRKFNFSQEELEQIAALFDERKLLFVPPVGFWAYHPQTGIWTVDTNLEYTTQLCKSSPNPAHSKFAEFISSVSAQKVHDFLLAHLPNTIIHPTWLNLDVPYQIINTREGVVDLVSGKLHPHSPFPIFTNYTLSSPPPKPDNTTLDFLFKFILSHFPSEDTAQSFIKDLLYSITTLPPRTFTILHYSNHTDFPPPLMTYIAKALYPFVFLTTIPVLRSALNNSTPRRKFPHPPFPYQFTCVRVFIVAIDHNTTKKDLRFLLSPTISNILTFSPLTVVSFPMNVSKPYYYILPTAKFIFITAQPDVLLDTLSPTILQHQLTYNIYPFSPPPQEATPPPSTYIYSHLHALLTQKLAPAYLRSHITISKLVKEKVEELQELQNARLS